VPTRNVRSTKQLDRAGSRTLDRAEQQCEVKLTVLRSAIDEGDSSGVAPGDVLACVRKSLKLPKTRRDRCPTRLVVISRYLVLVQRRNVD